MNLHDSLAYSPVELAFGTSGLRGLVADMTDLECYINTRGFIAFLEKVEGLQPGSTISLAGDLRGSTPQIMKAVAQAIIDAGYIIENCGLIPTPALAYWALQRSQPGIMVTGSHIPADRNGIKFNKISGEVLKADEAGIKQAVAEVRQKIYENESNQFDTTGRLVLALKLPEINPTPATVYIQRFINLLPEQMLADKQVVVYQHSAVGRDMLVEILQTLGAKVTPVDRSDIFIPIDTENVTPENQSYFRSLAKKYPEALAIVSTDGDSDRPFVIDESGEFHRGDVLGVVVAAQLKADFAAYPVSSSDAVDIELDRLSIERIHTKVGSPHVITAMQTALAQGFKTVVGWEVNGGFLTGSDITYNQSPLSALPTRDAFFPILLALAASLTQNKPISQLFNELPQRFTQAGLIDNFATEDSRKIIETLGRNDEAAQSLIKNSFARLAGYNKVKKVDSTDGIRITFGNGDIAHIRPSGNAPQLRIYSVAGSQQQADKIVALGIAEDGILRTLQRLINQ